MRSGRGPGTPKRSSDSHNLNQLRGYERLSDDTLVLDWHEGRGSSNYV
jgi:hypothetical protein